MTPDRFLRITLILAVCAGVAACGSRRTETTGFVGPVAIGADPEDVEARLHTRDTAPVNYDKSSIWDVFGPNKGDQTVNVNRYLWAATFDVLSFLPVQSVDPFTGIIVTGYGTPPGGGRSYRATVHVRDPSLDARSLNVSLQSNGGAVSAATTRAVEDAILARARQLRIRDKKL